MVEPGVVGVGSAVNAVAKSGLVKQLFGPSADVVGKYWADKLELELTERSQKQAEKIAIRAAERARLAEEGSVPPRLALGILEQAATGDNEFVAEYLSGVLASGRTADGTNDAALPWSALVGRLSADQLAMHWFIYTGLQRRVVGQPEDDYWQILQNRMLVDNISLLTSLGWPLHQDINRALQRAREALYGLQREGLLCEVSHGGGDFLMREHAITKGRDLDEKMGYMFYGPTGDGVALLMYGLGLGQRWQADFLKAETLAAIYDSPSMPAISPATLLTDVPMGA